MTDAFRVVVPAPGRRTTGMLRPAVGARAGILVVEDTNAHSPLCHAICSEVELYLHAAGLHTLTLNLPVDATIGTRASRILGGVSMLRSLECDKIVLITSTRPREVSQSEASAESASELLDLVVRDARSVPEVLRLVRDLTVTIRDVAESVVGVAALVARPSAAHMGTARSRRAVSRIPPESSRMKEFTGQQGTAVGSVAGPASLLVPLPAGDDTSSSPHALVQAVSQLYVWTLTLTRPEAPQEEIQATARRLAIGTMSAGLRDWNAEQWKREETVRADWHTRLLWADREWEALLGRLMARHPDRGAEVRQAALPAGVGWGYSMRSARLAWRFLTIEERRLWLQVNSALFRG